MDRQNIGKFSETVRDFAGPETQKDRAGERTAATPDRSLPPHFPGRRILPRGRNLGHGDNMIAALLHRPLRRIVVTAGVNRLREHEKVRIVEGEEK
jgi:hypothetical protein